MAFELPGTAVWLLSFRCTAVWLPTWNCGMAFELGR